MVIYDSAYIYLESCKTLQEKINGIDLIIEGLLNAAVKAAENEGISEYQLNDGQTIIKTVYRGVNQIFSSVSAFERLKQMYVNRLNGRVIRLVDEKNFNGRGYGR